jgi:hypothetical protein
MPGRVGLKSDLHLCGLGRRGRGTLPPYLVILGMDQAAAAGVGVPGRGLKRRRHY